MKKIVALILTAIFALAVVAGCGASGNAGSGSDAGSGDSSSAQSGDSVKTIADLAQFESTGYTYSDDTYVCVYEDNGTYYRAYADIPKDVSDELSKLSWEDADHDQKQAELLNPLEITKVENLSDQLLSQEDLDKIVGETGQKMLDDGWTANGGSDPDNSVVFMEYGPFQYSVTFDKAVDEAGDTSIEDQISSLTVESVSFISVSSDAANVD